MAALPNARVRESSKLRMVDWRTQYHLFAGVALRQSELNRTDADEQNQIESAPDEMRFDGGINLFFHFFTLEEVWSEDKKRLFLVRHHEHEDLSEK